MKRSSAAKRTNESRLVDKSLDCIVRICFFFTTKCRIVKSKCPEIGVSGKKGNILYQVSNVRVKCKIVTFASQPITEFKQFLTRPNLACSVAKTDRRFFSVLMFHETISN